MKELNVYDLCKLRFYCKSLKISLVRSSLKLNGTEHKRVILRHKETCSRFKCLVSTEFLNFHISLDGVVSIYLMILSQNPWHGRAPFVLLPV